jgi:tetratricopeptide (TPR) repeat protein
MTLISIREIEEDADGNNAEVCLDGGQKVKVKVTDPFTEEQEELLGWYFEDYIKFPFTDRVDAQRASESIKEYGEKLFNQVFDNSVINRRYMQAMESGAENLAIEIAGSPDFHKLHWEAIKDPSLPNPLVLTVPIVRRNLEMQVIRANPRESPTINLLIVTARPGGTKDVGYRTISRPLVSEIRQAGLRVKVDILRPGTYKELVNHLLETRDKYGTGYYHVIHFDVHGALLTFKDLDIGFKTNQFTYQSRFGRGDIKEYEELKAFLFLESEKEKQSDPLEAGELANLLLEHQIPITILNACQSGKQVGTEETSLGSRLMKAGVQMVLAMGYSVTVSAAQLMMRTLYRKIFEGYELPSAIRRARLELFNQKGRRVYFNQVVDLEDWILPVVYENQHLSLRPRDFTLQENKDYYEKQTRNYEPPKTTYGFVGRDLDVLEIEKRLLLKRNVLLIKGMAGSGKTSLLHHLGSWWQTTGFVDQVFYFGYDDKAHTLQQIMMAIAKRLMTDVEYAGGFQPLSLDAQRIKLAGILRANRHLLILDNLESITATNLAIPNTLTRDEQEKLHAFLTDLSDGKTLVLLGSRGGEEWLSSGTFEKNVYDLPGLDPEATSTLADLILERYGTTKYRQDRDLGRLLKLLDGYPLPMEVVLANLSHQTPAEILTALEKGDEGIDMHSEKKTESILKCIDYSFGNISPEAQDLLACLAPFTSVINISHLPQYTEQLRKQPALSKLPFDRWQNVLQEAVNWGLLTPHHEIPIFISLQPIFPYFLRSRLNSPMQAEKKMAIETTFRQHYDDIGLEIWTLLQSKEANQKQIGQVLARFEYENLYTALNLALSARVSIVKLYGALSSYIDTTQDHRRGLELGKAILISMETYPKEILKGQLGLEFASIIDGIATRQLKLKRYDSAEASYKKALDILSQQKEADTKLVETGKAGILHRLGMVAHDQRQYKQAEEYYKKALEIKIEYKDRYEQASTYHELGIVAQAQRQYKQAKEYYKKALEIFIEFNAYEQASTYHQLGRVAQEQRQYKRAEKYYKKALEIKIKIEFNAYGQASTYHQLGRVAKEQRQYKQAKEYYKKALEIKIEYKDRYDQAVTYLNLGVIAHDQRQYEQAREYYMQALRIYVEYKDEYYIAMTLRNLAILWQASNDGSIPDLVASAMGVSSDEAKALFTNALKSTEQKGEG